MENKTVLFGVAGLIAGFVLGTLVGPSWFPSAGGNGMMSGRTNMMGNGAGGMMGNIDRHFIEQMIPHHEGAIAMAKLALERSKRPEILSLAENIIEAQESEITKMRAWYEEWFGGTPTQNVGMGMGMGMHMDGMTGDVDELAAAADFDVEFIEQMIPHHEMAVMMARMLAAATERPEMSALAEAIVTSQSAEIEMMRDWQSEWSGR